MPPTVVPGHHAQAVEVRRSTYQKTGGTPCMIPVRGRLRACGFHRREKRAVWLARIGIRKPSARLGHRVARPYRRGDSGEPGQQTLAIDKPVTDTITFACTLLGTAATVVSTAIGIVGLAIDLL